MFIHSVLFEIERCQLPAYRKDCRMWANHAKKFKGFVGSYTMERIGHNNQYASVYEWKSRLSHERFMKKLHDILVNKSKAKVKVLGYYNLKAVMKVK